jgi:hypothetical protein
LHDVSPGAVAFAWPLQSIVPAVVNCPCAVPVSLRSPAHVALKDPLALTCVCSETVHLKSEHELGEGIRFAEDQVPSNELLPAAVGPVGVLSCSKPMQPDARSADDSTAMRIRFFMFFISDGKRADFARPYFAGGRSIPIAAPRISGFQGLDVRCA